MSAAVLGCDPKTVRKWVAGVLAGIYAPEPNEEIWEWAARTLKIPATENEEMAGMPYDWRKTPYVQELMRWVRRPGKGEFWIKKSSQVGFTMAVLIIICWMIVHRPGNVAYAIDSITEAKNISKTRLRKWIELNNLLDEIGENADSMSNLTYFFRGMTVYMLGAHSKGGWANKSIALCILDELDKHPYIEGEGTTVTLARERVKRPKNAKIIGFSTPGESDQISIEHAKGTRELIGVPFPCCGHVQPLKWENFVFGSKEFRDLAGGYDREKILADAHFRCELCNGKLHDRDKAEAMLHYEAVVTNPAADPRIRSLHIWDAYSPFVTFGQLAIEWLDAQTDPTLLERFMRGRRGEKYEKSGRVIKGSDILACRGAYHRGTIPFRPLDLIQAIDIQGDVCKAMKVAIDEKENLHVVDWFTALSLEEATDWAQEPVIGPDEETFYVTSGFIDEGHRALDVRRKCLELCPLFWPVKGLANIQVREIVSSSHYAVDGEEILVYHIAEDEFKWSLLTYITDREKRKRRGDPCVFFPIEIEDDDQILEELCNERPVKKAQKSNPNKWKWVWEKTGPNDFWDCLKYALSLWTIKRPHMIRGGVAMSPSRPEN